MNRPNEIHIDLVKRFHSSAYLTDRKDESVICLDWVDRLWDLPAVGQWVRLVVSKQPVVDKDTYSGVICSGGVSLDGIQIDGTHTRQPVTTDSTLDDYVKKMWEPDSNLNGKRVWFWLDDDVTPPEPVPQPKPKKHGKKVAS